MTRAYNADADAHVLGTQDEDKHMDETEDGWYILDFPAFSLFALGNVA